MAVRRTREQKLKAQQRRTELFEWEPEAVQSDIPETKKAAESAKKSVAVNSKSKPQQSANLNNSAAPTQADQNLIKWLKTDLTRTALATLFIVFLIGLAYWITL